MAAAGMLSGLAACAPTVVPQGPGLTAPFIEDTVVRAADGAPLPLHSWLPAAGEPEAVVVALHGFNDYGTFFKTPGAYLAEHGIASYAYDQRGFGDAPHTGLWAGSAAMVDDLRSVTRVVRTRHPGVPLYLLGASMGGAVIMVAMASREPPAADGVILSAPAVWGRSTMPGYQRLALWLSAHTVPWLTLTGRGLKIRASDNIDMLRALGADPKVIKATRVDAMHGLTDLMGEALEAAGRLEARALILYGDNDQIIKKRPTREMLKRLPEAGAGRRRIAFYENGWHMLLRDLQGPVVWKDIVHWIGDPDAALPSGADARRPETVMGE